MTDGEKTFKDSGIYPSIIFILMIVIVVGMFILVDVLNNRYEARIYNTFSRIAKDTDTFVIVSDTGSNQIYLINPNFDKDGNISGNDISISGPVKIIKLNKCTVLTNRTLEEIREFNKILTRQ